MPFGILLSKEKTRKEPLTLLLYLPRGIQIEKPALQQEPWHIHLSTFERSVADRECSSRSLCQTLLCVPRFLVALQEFVCHVFALSPLPGNRLLSL